jgi:GT2 family glycosyltransferase
MGASVLGVSIVTYYPDLDLLKRTLVTLAAAIRYAQARGALASANVWIVDNTVHAPALSEKLDRLASDSLQPADDLKLGTIRGHGNVGYGRGNNLALERSGAAYHLVLNPDVELNEDAVYQALQFMETHASVGVLAPHVRNAHGETLYLCKAYPAVVDLLLRGFGPGWLIRRFKQRLHRYELRDRLASGQPVNVPLVSGCFMFFRKEILDRLGGFSPRYFLYFEDFDLSLRAARVADVVYVPAVRILHHGGYAAKKGLRHVRLFCASALRFYRAHGWKIV